MSLPVRTGRACGSYGCRWCGPKVETVVYEIRDTETGGIGDEVMCCICGKHQWRWGESSCAREAGEYAEKDRQWRREAHRQDMCEVAYRAWLSARIVEAFAPESGIGALAEPEPVPAEPAWADGVLFDLGEPC